MLQEEGLSRQGEQPAQGHEGAGEPSVWEAEQFGGCGQSAGVRLRYFRPDCDG